MIEPTTVTGEEPRLLSEGIDFLRQHTLRFQKDRLYGKVAVELTIENGIVRGLDATPMEKRRSEVNMSRDRDRR